MKMPRLPEGFWPFLRWWISPQIGLGDVIIVLAVVLYTVSYAVADNAGALLAQFAVIGLLCYCRGRDVERARSIEFARSMTQDILNRMVVDGIIAPGPNAVGHPMTEMPTDRKKAH